MSLTITFARWANPDQTRAAVSTIERGAVMLKPERPEWADLEAWIDAGGEVATFEPFRPSARRRRRRDFALELGADPGDEISTLGDVLDVVIRELRARGESATPEFATLVAKIDAIKARHPKP